MAAINRAYTNNFPFFLLEQIWCTGLWQSVVGRCTYGNEVYSVVVPCGRVYFRVFRVETDDPFDSSAVILFSGSIPFIGAAFPQDVRATCRRVTTTNEGFSPKVWIVKCHYSTQVSTEPLDNPLLEPARTTWTTEQYQKTIMKDLLGKAEEYAVAPEFEEMLRSVPESEHNGPVFRVLANLKRERLC